jgi:transcriptional regulator with XRE-family HTH domain
MAGKDNQGGRNSDNRDQPEAEGANRSLVEALIRRTGKVAGGTLDLALDVAAVAAMSGDSWLRSVVSNSASPERLEAMAEAGHFLRDARETAGLSINELSERLEVGDASVLEGVERGETILPLEIMLRAASLLARHDPIPFLIKFLRSYNPQLEATLEQWGVMALPRNFERERRFLNLYRQHDFLRDLSDDEHARFIDYMNASTQLVVDVMARERAANKPAKRRVAKRPVRDASRGAGAGAAKKPTVRKVKPRNKTKTQPRRSRDA